MAVIEPREGDCVKTWFGFGFFFLIKGFYEIHKGGFISQISDINPTQFLVFCSIKTLIMPLT